MISMYQKAYQKEHIVNSIETNIIHSTWSNDNNNGLHGHTIKVDVNKNDNIIPELPITKEFLKSIHNKVIIGIYDPLFKLITNGYISGQNKLENGVSTGKFNTVDYLNIPRTFGINRQIRLDKCQQFDGILYTPIVDESVGIGINKSYLTKEEKAFYSNFLFTKLEPSSLTLVKLVADHIKVDTDLLNLDNDLDISVRMI